MLHLNYVGADAALQPDLLVVNLGVMKSHKHPASLHLAQVNRLSIKIKLRIEAVTHDGTICEKWTEPIER